MKVGTDGVLLGAWARLPENKAISSRPRVLDVGTGTGLIALMLAQRFPNAMIDGIATDASPNEQANANIENPIFPTRTNIKE